MTKYIPIPFVVFPPNCDCGLPASWFMLTPIGVEGDRRMVQIPLCADCYRIENSEPVMWTGLRRDIRHYTWLLYDFSYRAMELR